MHCLLGQTERIRCLEYQRKHSSTSDDEVGLARHNHSSSSQDETDSNIQNQLAELQRKYNEEVALRQNLEQNVSTLDRNKNEGCPQVSAMYFFMYF